MQAIVYLDPDMIRAAKETEAPPNRNALQYGNAIATRYMVKLDRGPRSQWQRVYAICYSNCASHYVKAGAAGKRFLDAHSFERIETLTSASA